MEWKINNKTVLLLGGTSCIGKVTLLDIAKEGPCVIFTARDRLKAHFTLDEAI